MAVLLLHQSAEQPMAQSQEIATLDQAIDALRQALFDHSRQGCEIDPSLVTGKLEHRYSVKWEGKLVAVYWLSAAPTDLAKRATVHMLRSR